MKRRLLWSRILRGAGCLAMIIGSVDPLEGSVLILPGSGLVALGVYFSGQGRRTVRYWTWVFLLIALGVGAMFVLSAGGGIGGKSGRSMWWGLLMLPYLVGWLMALGGAIVALAGVVKSKCQRVPA